MLAFFGLSGCPCNGTSDLKELVYQRLWNILNGDDSTAEFQKIPAKTRAAGSRYSGANQAGFARLLEREIASTLVGESRGRLDAGPGANLLVTSFLSPFLSSVLPPL